jgi:hypothetical protein
MPKPFEAIACIILGSRYSVFLGSQSFLFALFSLPLCELLQRKMDVHPTSACGFWLLNYRRLTCVIFRRLMDGLYVVYHAVLLPWDDATSGNNSFCTSYDERLAAVT